MLHAVEGSSNVQGNHQGGTATVWGVVPGLGQEKEIVGGATFSKLKLSRGL